MNRTFIEKANNMLSGVALGPKKIKIEVVSVNCYLINKSPRPILDQT